MSKEVFDDMTLHKVTVYRLETLGKDDIISTDVDKDMDQIIQEELRKLALYRWAKEQEENDG